MTEFETQVIAILTSIDKSLATIAGSAKAVAKKEAPVASRLADLGAKLHSQD